MRDVKSPSRLFVFRLSAWIRFMEKSGVPSGLRPYSMEPPPGWHHPQAGLLIFLAGFNFPNPPIQS